MPSVKEGGNQLRAGQEGEGDESKISSCGFRRFAATKRTKTERSEKFPKKAFGQKGETKKGGEPKKTRAHRGNVAEVSEEGEIDARQEKRSHRFPVMKQKREWGRNHIRKKQQAIPVARRLRW